MKSKFRYSLENFRGIAIIFVMLSHIRSFQEIEQIGGYLYYIVGDATAWFVFISGYLFYYLEVNKFEYRAYISKKARYVIMPYLILSFPAILFLVMTYQYRLYGLTPLTFILWSLTSGGIAVGPMWFIPMITIFFLFTPIFIILSKSKLLCTLTAISLAFSIFSARPVYNTNAILSFLHFFGFYLLGILAAKNSIFLEELRTTTKITIIFISFSFFVFFCFLFPGLESMPNGFLSGLGMLNYILAGKLFLLIAIFFLFEQFFEHENKTLGFFAKISFGLFFIHGFMEVIFNKMWKNINYFNSIIKLVAEIIIVIFVSVAIVFLAKRILKKWSRYVIGC
ncbi:hypothetical protein CSQ93_00760 [Janthinobacterium sp. BJB426]|uniref:acyltransferase family protein n=1 Tax=Janthinobacterium sp. BJB426 TaxID=2048010 RepID=UPI000C0D54FA|nr:acyltransferase [Janthinobacterium sp. BJB426]PHV29704.1 hypothetical protein CSQ93_00760 [Janthinobacterium sp. BJB426]